MNKSKRNTNNCCVYGCRNYQKDSPYSFFRLPKEADRREIWLNKIGRTDLLTRTNLNAASYKVCSVHFDKSVVTEVLTRQLLPWAVPTKFLPEQEPSTSNNEGKSSFDMSTQTDESFINDKSKTKTAFNRSVDKEDGVEITEVSAEEPSTSASSKRKICTTSAGKGKKKQKKEIIKKHTD